MLEYAFMQRSLLAGLMLGVAVPLVGVAIVLRRLSMVGDALSHTSLAGVAGGLVAGVSPVAGAAIACLAGAFCIEGVRRRFREQSELAVAIVLAAGIGTAGVLSGVVPNAASFSSFLFGSILTVSLGELVFIALVSVAALVFCTAFSRALLLLSYDEEQARVCGVRVAWANALLVIVTALVVAVASRTVGSLMVSSMMVVPVACALQLAGSWRRVRLLSSALGVTITLVGLTLSFYLGLKPGGTIVLVGVALLGAILLTKRVARSVAARKGRARAGSGGELRAAAQKREA